MLKTLLAQIKEYKKPSILASVFTILEVVFELIIPLLMASVIDKGIEVGDMSQVYLYGGLMIVSAICGLLSGIAAGRFAATASAGVASNIRDTMYEKIQTYSFSNIDKYSSAGLVTRLTTDVTNFQNAYQMIIRMFVRAPISFISALVMAIWISPRMGIVFGVAIVFLAIVLGFIMTHTMPMFSKVFEKYDDLNESVQENITGIRVVKAFVREDYEKDKFSKAADTIYQLFVKAEGTLAFNNPAMMLAMYGCIIAISWVGANQIVGGTLTTGELTSLFTYCTSILMSLMILSMIFVMLTMSYASMKRIVEVINEQPDIVNPENPVMEVQDGSIVFDHVNFSYDKNKKNDYVLTDVNLNIEAGQFIGIVGATGSSKSSLVNLIPRLYDVTDGSIQVGGVDVRDYDITSLRDAVSVVLQKNQLFSGTILDNLRWGNENATEDECIAACKIAQADDFVTKFPDGYQTYIEQGGTNVSGGQRQRLCIARALIKNPKVLILDDSTSAVDTATDAKIQKAFREELAGTTKLVIAQRISSVQYADQIIVLKEGKIDGIGTHEELINTNEIYRGMYIKQTNGGDFDD